MATDVIARLQLQGQQFSSESARLWAGFEASARDTSTRAKNYFEASFDQIKRLANDAASRPLNAAGSLDLNVNEFRQAAQAAQLRAVALREVENAMRAAAASERDTTEATRLAIQATNAAAIEAEQLAANLTTEANAWDRVQTELNQTASATRDMSRATAEGGRQIVKSHGATSQATIQASQQFQDFFIQVQGGQSVLTAFSQQGSHLAIVMSGVGGKVGALARFFAGPWGTAIFAGLTVLSMFTKGLWDNAEAADAAKAGSDGLSEAQGALGRMFDLTTGKLKEQNEYLVLNARLTAANLRAEAQREAESSRKTFDRAGEISHVGGLVGGLKDGGLQGAIVGLVGGSEMGQRNTSNLANIVQNVRNGSLSRETALRLAETQDFTDASVTRKEFQQALLDAVSSVAKEGFAKDIDKSLDTGKLGDALRRDTKAKKTPDRSKEVSSIEEFGRDTLDRLANLQAPFAGQPKMIDAAAKALREVADITDDVDRKNARLLKLTGKGLPGYELIKQQLVETASVIRDGLDKPFRDFMDSEREALEIQKLITQGHSFEAGVLQDVLRIQKQQGALDGPRLQAAIDIVKARRDEARASEITLERTQNYLSAVRDVRASVERVFETLPDQGVKSLGDFVKNLRGSFNVLVSKEITEKLFGNIFRDIEDKITGADKVDKAADIIQAALQRTSESADRVTASFDKMASRATSAATEASGVSGSDLGSIIDGLRGQADAEAGKSAANDNQSGIADDIVVVGRKIDSFAKSPTQLFSTIGGDLLGKIFGDKIGKSVGDKVGTALQGAFYGQTAASLVLGNKGSNTGAALGGAIGGVAGEALKGTITATLGKTLGGLAGPLGSIAGGLLGSVVGGLLKKTKTGVATLSITNGEAGVGSVGGNNAGLRSNATKLGGSVGDSLQNIAESLGGDLSGSLSVSIGQRNKKFVVDPTGAGRTKGAGVLKFTDEQDAIEAAIRDALSDGVIGGISAASQRILASGQDLERAITKASLIESIPKELKARLDPVGAAIDEVNEKWEKTVAALKEGGASAEQMAQAQQLYNLELDDAKNNTAGASSSLKEFVDSLKFGSSSPYSLRDQEASALANLQPYLDKIAAGQTVDNDKYVQAAQAYLDIERQLKGSTDGYFAELDRIQAATAQAISTIDNATPIRTASDPFAEKTATNTQATADILAQNTVLLQQIANLIAAGGGGGGGFGGGYLLTQQV